MTETKNVQERHTAGPQAIGFDYQFYYFMLLALELRHGQKIGFEVKDDVHIDKEDGTTILFQTKHTILENSNGVTQNLTTLDTDLWKTFSNWADFIKNQENYLDKHSFVLVTNKSENNNEFINSLNQFKNDKNIAILTKLNDLKDKTKDKTIQKYIENLISLDEKLLYSFLSKVSIEIGVDEIIERIKNKLLVLYRDNHIVETIYDSLYSNLQLSKYLEIKSGQRFEITFDDFNKKFKKCFKVATEPKPLPKREFPVLLPDDLESQIFIKQLLDIGVVQTGSNNIRHCTTQMLKFLNNFTYWSEEENFILLTDIEEFKNNSIQIWINKFEAKYRQIKCQITNGSSIEDLEDDIKKLGVDLVDYIREQDLSIPGFPALGIEFSNGHYYALSDNLEIGWHFDWSNKYKK